MSIYSQPEGGRRSIYSKIKHLRLLLPYIYMKDLESIE